MTFHNIFRKIIDDKLPTLLDSEIRPVRCGDRKVEVVIA